MPDVIIADTSVLIVFSKIDAMGLLQRMYGAVIVTPEVADEYGAVLPSWISVRAAVDKKYVVLLRTQVDAGEASAIALGMEFRGALLLLDDLKARKLAVNLGLRIAGTLGVILKARERGVIADVVPYIEKLRMSDFYISEVLMREVPGGGRMANGEW